MKLKPSQGRGKIAGMAVKLYSANSQITPTKAVVPTSKIVLFSQGRPDKSVLKYCCKIK